MRWFNSANRYLLYFQCKYWIVDLCVAFTTPLNKIDYSICIIRIKEA